MSGYKITLNVNKKYSYRNLRKKDENLFNTKNKRDK